MWCAVRYILDFTFSNPFKPFNILSTHFAPNTTLDIFPIHNLNQRLLSQVEVVDVVAYFEIAMATLITTIIISIIVFQYILVVDVIIVVILIVVVIIINNTILKWYFGSQQVGAGPIEC